MKFLIFKNALFFLIKVTPTAVARKSTAAMYQTLNSGNDHEYFSTPITPSTGSATPTSRIYMTPTVSSPVVHGSHHTGGPLLMPNTKVEARRRLNLDSALVDRDGFKTPIKGTKRKADFSSPSPKKCKYSLVWPNGSPDPSFIAHSRTSYRVFKNCQYKKIS